MAAPAVDVIIAARNEARSVGACIDALRQQAYTGPVRICVVDNASTDATARLAAARGAEVVREPRRGRGTARNAGLRATGASLVAFLDAHVVADPDWLRRMVEAFADADVGGCQGRLVQRAIVARLDRHLQASAARLAEHALADSVRGERNLYPWLSTASCMYRRAALDEVGGFNEQLAACEDVELSWRVIARGYRLRYLAEVPATHYEGRSWLRFATKGFGYGRGAAQVDALYRPHGARTTFSRVELRRDDPTALLDALSYRLGFRLQQLAQRLGYAPHLEPVPLRDADARFRPWVAWMPGEHLRISPGALYWLDDDRPSAIAVHPRAGQRYVLDGTTNFVWRLLVRAHSRNEIVGDIVAEYGIPPAQAALDLDELIDAFAGAGLVERRRDPPSSERGRT